MRQALPVGSRSVCGDKPRCLRFDHLAIVNINDIPQNAGIKRQSHNFLAFRAVIQGRIEVLPDWIFDVQRTTLSIDVIEVVADSSRVHFRKRINVDAEIDTEIRPPIAVFRWKKAQFSKIRAIEHGFQIPPREFQTVLQVNDAVSRDVVIGQDCMARSSISCANFQNMHAVKTDMPGDELQFVDRLQIIQAYALSLVLYRKWIPGVPVRNSGQSSQALVRQSSAQAIQQGLEISHAVRVRIPEGDFEIDGTGLEVCQILHSVFSDPRPVDQVP